MLLGDSSSNYIIYISDIALAVGLYGSVYGIDIGYLKKNINVVFSAVTIGVLLKIAIIGAILWVYMESPVAFLLAAIIAQIDPLSVSALENHKYLSKDGETVLRSWSSFDDPVTIIISLWMATFIYLSESVQVNEAIYSATIAFYYNIAMAIIIYFLWRFMKPINKTITCFSLLALSILLAIIFELFLGLAIIALFVRPPLYDLENKIIFIALLIVSLTLGILLSNGVNLLIGIIMGVATIISQLLVSFFLTEKMTFHDRIKLSFAHQSGITAISLSLYFLHYDSSIMESVAVAIFFINFSYMVTNYIADNFIIPLYDKK